MKEGGGDSSVFLYSGIHNSFSLSWFKGPSWEDWCLRVRWWVHECRSTENKTACYRPLIETFLLTVLNFCQRIQIRKEWISTVPVPYLTIWILLLLRIQNSDSDLGDSDKLCGKEIEIEVVTFIT
jgi:hypothetical protein